MTLSLRFETSPLSRPKVPEDFALPTLNQLEKILQDRREFIASRRDILQDFSSCLLQEHQAQGAPPSSIENIQRLTEPDTYVVVTGQQPGLLTGPLYSIWKILSAISLAQILSKTRKEHFIPLFWNAGEDHDTEEMNHFFWLDQESNLTSYRLDLSDESGPVAFGNRPVQQLNLDRLFEHWDITLPPTDFSPNLKTLIRHAYDRANTLGEFFNQLVWHLVPESGLIILNSASRNYQQYVKDLLEKEIRNSLVSASSVNQAAERLSAHGLKPQMHRAPGRSSFFLFEDNFERRFTLKILVLKRTGIPIPCRISWIA